MVTGRFWYDWVKPRVHLGRIWASRKISTHVKVQLYNSHSPGSVTLWSRDLANDKINDQEVVSSTSQVAQEDHLTHFVDKVTNERVRELAQQGLLEDIIRERRLRWAGHVMRIDSRRIARQATNWKPIDGRRRPGRPRTDWQQTGEVDIRGGGIWQLTGEPGGS